MTLDTLQPMLEWIMAHPHWAGIVVFLLSLGESLVGIGLFIPGLAIMGAIGWLVGTGVLDLTQTLIWAILGAIVGDSMSYWVGRYYHQSVRNIWPFRSHPEWLARGTTFFEKHGGKSIVFGRFIGPVRPIIPVIAGMMDMPPNRFLFANVLSAVAWAPAYLLPGILIGSSLGKLSHQVVGRLSLIILLALLAIWGIALIVGFIGRRLWHLTERILRRYTSEEHARRIATHVAVFSSGLIVFVALWISALHAGMLTSFNAPLFHLLQCFRTPLVDRIMQFASDWADTAPIAIMYAIMLAWLVWLRQFRAVVHALLAFIITIMVALVFKQVMASPRPFLSLAGLHDGSFPSGHTLRATLLLGVAAYFIARDFVFLAKRIVYLTAGVLIACVAISRLYLGAHWLTDVIAAIALGCAGIGFMALSFEYHRDPKVPPIGLAILMSVSIIGIGGGFATWRWLTTPPAEQANIVVSSQPLENWWKTGGINVPVTRDGTLGKPLLMMNVQWATSLENIKAILASKGWREPPKLTPSTALRWLSPETNVEDLPLLPLFHKNYRPALVLYKTDPTTPHKRWVLQLWPSHIELINSKQESQPLWIGVVDTDVLTTHMLLTTLFKPTAEFNVARDVLANDLPKSTWRHQARQALFAATRHHDKHTVPVKVLLVYTPASAIRR